jgi:hypothetical protein
LRLDRAVDVAVDVVGPDAVDDPVGFRTARTCGSTGVSSPDEKPDKRPGIPMTTLSEPAALEQFIATPKTQSGGKRCAGESYRNPK